MADNYSVLNNYNYEDKPDWLSVLDCLSSPCRSVLGGRDICLLSATEDDETSTTCKVIILVFSILVFPVVIVSTASLAIKLVTFPWFWEGEWVEEQRRLTGNIINQFNQAHQNGDYDNAIQNFRERPEIRARFDVNEKLFQIVNRKINAHASWEELEGLLPLLKRDDAIGLINHAVKVKLKDDLSHNYILVHATRIFTLLYKSLENDAGAIKSCYEKLLSDALRIDMKEDIILNALKMDIGDYIIGSMTHHKIQHAKDELERTVAQAEEYLLRNGLFIKDGDYVHYSAILNDKEDMNQIRAAIQGIRSICQLSCELLENLKGIAADLGSPEAKWQDIRALFAKFQTILNVTTAEETDSRNYVETMQKLSDIMIRFIDTLGQEPTAQQIEDLNSETGEWLLQQPENFKKMLHETSVSWEKPPLENLLATLRLKKIVTLFLTCEQMQLFLLNAVKEVSGDLLPRDG